MMLNRRHFLTTSTVLSLGSLLGLTLTPSVQSQGRMTKPGLGFTFVMPEGYGEDDRVGKKQRAEGGPPVVLYLTDGGVVHEDDQQRLTKTLLTGIYVMSDALGTKRSNSSVSIHVSGEENKKPNSNEAQKLFEERLKALTPEEKTRMQANVDRFAKSLLPQSYAYQNGTVIAVDGFPTIAILASYDDKFSQIEVTVRFLFVFTKTNVFLFYAGYNNSEFENRSKAFMNFIQSVKFAERPEGEKKLEKKATPKKTQKNKSTIIEKSLVTIY